jgi:hypothetical protein
VLYHRILFVFAQVPASGRLEFHLCVFASGDQRGNFEIAGLGRERAESFERSVLHRLRDEGTPFRS